MSAAYVIAGITHFLAPKAFARVVPPGLSRPRALVYLSGVAEIGLGLGVAFDRTRRAAAWARLPLQGVLLLWAWWYTVPEPESEGDDDDTAKPS